MNDDGGQKMERGLTFRGHRVRGEQWLNKGNVCVWVFTVCVRAHLQGRGVGQRGCKII